METGIAILAWLIVATVGGIIAVAVGRWLGVIR